MTTTWQHCSLCSLNCWLKRWGINAWHTGLLPRLAKTFINLQFDWKRTLALSSQVFIYKPPECMPVVLTCVPSVTGITHTGMRQSSLQPFHHTWAWCVCDMKIKLLDSWKLLHRKHWKPTKRVIFHIFLMRVVFSSFLMDASDYVQSDNKYSCRQEART